MTEKIANDLRVHRRSGTDRDASGMFVLRRNRRTRYKPVAFRFGYQRIEEKLRCTFHYRIGARKKLLIAGELVVIPKVRAQPGAASGPEAPEWTIDRSGLSPKIG